MSQARGEKPAAQKEVVSEEGEFLSERMGMMISAIMEDKQKERLSAFSKEKTDEDRFNFIWSMPTLHEVIELEEEYTGKSSTDAAALRAKGNKYFQNKSFLSALDAYSKSIIQAPVYKEGRDNTNELALAYGNRSAALFYLQRYHDCLDDIDLAFQSEYPKDSYYKLYDRQGKCYLAIGDRSVARDCFNKALENVQESGLDERVLAKWNENLNTLLQSCVDDTQKQQEECPVMAPVAPGLTHSPQEKYSHMCKDIKPDYSKNLGRHLKAEEDISVGDVLITEKPYAAVLYQEQYDTHCYSCLVKVDKPIPCTQCSTVIFCSQKCREKAWQQHHQYECRFFVLFDKLLCARVGHLAIRMVMVAGLPFLLEYVRNQKNQQLSGQEVTREEIALNKDGVYASDYHSVYHLETNTKDRFPINLLDYSVIAAYLTKALIASNFFRQNGEDYSSSDNIRLIGAVLLRHLLIIQCNANRVEEAVAGTQFDQRGNMSVTGIALYPTASLVNHACDPAGDFVFYGDTLVLRAIRDINQGEEVNVSYGLVYFDNDRKARQQQLRECYFFTCQCVACEECWPTVSQLEDCSISFKCEACHKPLDLSRNPYKKIAACEECEHEQNMEETVSKLEISHHVFCNAMVDAFSGRYDDALEKFIKHLRLLQKYVNQPWRDFTSCQLCIKQCYRLKASQWKYGISYCS